MHLCIEVTWRDELEISAEDDGVGLQPGKVLEDEGGHGLALHSTMMAVTGGTLAVEGVSGAYTRISLTLPGEVLSLYGDDPSQLAVRVTFGSAP